MGGGEREEVGQGKSIPGRGNSSCKGLEVNEEQTESQASTAGGQKGAGHIR